MYFKVLLTLRVVLVDTQVDIVDTRADSLWAHWLQHASLPYPSLSTGVCSNPSNHLTSVVPFSCLQYFPASGSFPMSQLFKSGGQSIEAPASELVLRVNIQGWFPLGLTCFVSLLSRAAQEASPAPQVKSVNYLALRSLFTPALTSIHNYWKNHSFDCTDLCQQSDVSTF